MIKINLLPQKRARIRPARADSATRALMFGGAGLAVAAAAVAVFVDHPKRSRLAALTESNRQLQNDIQSKNKQLEGYAQLKKDADQADERFRSIQRLLSAKVVPAHVLHELGEILTPNKYPTMTEDMTRRTASDPNRRFAADWDATHVWLSGFTDSGGVFKLEGGAQTESDVTQLAKRLAASVFFTDVTPAGGERVSDTQTGTNYYKFTITGKVAY
ncbi:MAG TPA: PilN domain-containing protein [Kofleriaceae bacterium]|nr:PilN domain-containing protein [Kofleriaceae bacterium]